MKNSLQKIGYLPLIMAIALGVGGYYVPHGYFQELVLHICATLLGLGLGIVLVNQILASSDKRVAARPLLQLVLPNVEKLHDTLFIERGRAAFGKDKFEGLLAIYQKHDRSPQAFTPQDRDDLFAHIDGMRDQINEQFDLLTNQFRELSTIVGWSFDPRIVAAALNARLQFVAFKALPTGVNISVEDKLRTIELFIDAEAESCQVVTLFAEHLGKKRNEVFMG